MASLPAPGRSRWHLQIGSRFLKGGGAGWGRRRCLLEPWAAQQTQERNFCTGQCCQKPASGCQPTYVQTSNLEKQDYRKSKLLFLTWPMGFDQGSTWLLLESILSPDTAHMDSPSAWSNTIEHSKRFSFLFSFSKAKEGCNLRNQSKNASFKSITSSLLGSLNPSLICILRESKAHCPHDTGAGREEWEHSGQEGGLQRRHSPHLEMLWRLLAQLILS